MSSDTATVESDSRTGLVAWSVLASAAVTLMLLVAATAAYLEYAATYVVFPGNQDYGEGPILYQLEWLRTLGTMYRPIDHAPYAVSNYPPVFHYATWLMTNLVEDPLMAGRLVSVLATLACSALIFTLVYRLSGPMHPRTLRAFGSVLGALFFLTHYAVTLWSVMARVDMLGLAFGLLGMLIFDLALRRGNRLLACLFGLTFVLAVYTKQNMIAAAAATFVTAFIADRSLAYAAMAASVPAGLLGIVILEAGSGGEFLPHAFYYNINDFQWDRLLELTLTVVSLNPVEVLILLFGSAYLLVSWRKWRTGSPSKTGDRRDMPLILLSGFMAFSLLNVVSSLKQGAAANYYVEFQAAGSLLLGVGAVRFQSFLRRQRLDPDYAKYCLGAILALFLVSYQTVYGWEKKYQHPIDIIVPHMERVIELVESVDGPVISEDMVLLYKSGKPLYYQPFIMTRLATEGRWNPAPIFEKLRHGQIPMIVLVTEPGSRLYEDRFAPEFTEAITSRYRLLERFGHFSVYVPS